MTGSTGNYGLVNDGKSYFKGNIDVIGNSSLNGNNNLKNALKILDISSGTFYKFVNMYIDKNEIKKSTITKQK